MNKSNTDISFEITTKILPNDEIIQEVDMMFCGTRENVLRAVADSREVGFRNALISLGWTPPAGDI